MSQYHDIATIDAVVPPESTTTKKVPLLVPDRINKGQRHNILWKMLRSQKARGMSFKAAFTACEIEDRDRCEPPLKLDEAEYQRWWNESDQPDFGKQTSDFPRTESGDAEYFADRNANRVCFDARRHRWLLIEDESGLWLSDPVERLRSYAVETMRARQRDANEIEDLEKREEAWKWAIKGESTTRLNNLIREARTQPAIRNDSHVDPWDADAYLLGVPGGVVDLRTGKNRKAHPQERITMRAGVEYDADAQSPLWESTLLEISNDDTEWVNYLQRLGGYTITGDTAQDKWFIKHGKDGREGKGTIDGAWAGALGDYVLELPSAVFELHPKGNPDFDLSYLPNKRFVLSSESGNTVHLHHDRIKQMTGGGSMRVANKHEKSFEFMPSCKLWLACNDLPTVTDDSSAFWARVIVIPFRRSFLGKENTTLRPMLSNDLAHRRAVLAWLVKGAIDYYRDGLGDMPKSVRDATDAFRAVAWPLTPLVREDCNVGGGMEVSVGDFNAAYQRFCDRQGAPKDKRLGWKRVLKLMEARYSTKYVDETTQGDVRVREKRYVGIGLREPITESDAPTASDMPF
jgi:putative DNA primase/helicase